MIGNLTPFDISLQVGAAFVHSLLRVVPYESCFPLPLPGAVISEASATEAASEDIIESNEKGSSRTAPSDRQCPLDQDIIHGGDVVRFFHLSSTGFLSYDHSDEAARPDDEVLDCLSSPFLE